MKNRSPLLVGLLVVVLLTACVAATIHAFMGEGMSCTPATTELSGKSLPFATVSAPLSWQAWSNLDVIPYVLLGWDLPENLSKHFFSTLPTRSPPIRLFA
jgi:hypothetical protein